MIKRDNKGKQTSSKRTTPAETGKEHSDNNNTNNQSSKPEKKS